MSRSAYENGQYVIITERGSQLFLYSDDDLQDMKDLYDAVGKKYVVFRRVEEKE